MQKLLGFILLLALWTLPSKAAQATVSVTAGSSHTFADADIPDAIRNDADNMGYTLIGWTTAAIEDGQLPAAYYGIHATVRSDANTTYYAFFARRVAKGTRLIRQITTPADGDTVMLVVSSGSLRYIAPNGNGYTQGSIEDVQLTESSSAFSDNLYKGANWNIYTWKYIVHDADTFKLQAAYPSAPERYLFATTTSQLNVGSTLNEATGKFKFWIKNGHPYNRFADKNIYLVLNSGKYYWRPSNKNDYSTTFAFYRLERYEDFVTNIEKPCPNCFIYRTE